MRRLGSLICLICFAVLALIVSFQQTGFYQLEAMSLKQAQQRSTPEPVPQLGLMRVKLTPQAVKSLTLMIKGDFDCVDLKTQQVLLRKKQLKLTSLTLGPQGSFWLGSEQIQAKSFELVPSRTPAIWVNQHQYRGRIRIYQKSAGRLIAVNLVSLEQYLASVVNSEMPASFPIEARKAQVIAARTYALYQRAQRKGHPEFDLYANAQSQMYLGFQYKNAAGKKLAAETPESRRLVRETAGLVCLYQNQLFCTYYSAVCGGKTVQGIDLFRDAKPLLKQVKCNWCQAASRYRWSKTISLAKVSQSLKNYFQAKKLPWGKFVSLKSLSYDLGPMALYQVQDQQRSYQLTAQQLRQIFAPNVLLSTRFRVQQDSTSLQFEGQGFGHGVGLCQWGARGLAKAGKNKDQILAYYYPGVTIRKWTKRR